MIKEGNKHYFTIAEGDAILEWLKKKVWSYDRLGMHLYVTCGMAKNYVLGLAPVPRDVIERFKTLNIEGVNYEN